MSKAGQRNAYGWLMCVLVGCGGAQPSGSTPAPVEAPAAAAEIAPSQDSNPGVEAHASTSVAHDVAAPTATPGVVLPTSTDFTNRPIPPGDPARYANWKQVGQTRIGKGYLHAEPLDERRLLVKSTVEPVVRIVDVATHRELTRWTIVNVEADEEHVVLPWRGEGEQRVLVGKRDGLWLYAVEREQPLARLAGSPVTAARWSDDGQVLITAEVAIPAQTANLRVYVVEKDALRLAAELPQTERVDAWALSRDNRYLARVFYPSDTVTVVDLHTSRTLLTAPAQRYVGSVEFSPNGRWLVLGGEGVKWFDLGNPKRRTEFTHFYNNVGDVEFSPSGDVVAVASYDGQVRLLSYDEQRNRITELRRFSHQKHTNVYTVTFVEGGQTLVSSSGDQTLRYWSSGSAAHAAASPATERWRSPEAWADWSKAQRQENDAGASSNPHISEMPGTRAPYTPARLNGPASPSRIKPGQYACKVSTGYKLRRCSVEMNENGHTLLEFDQENLLGLRGVLYDDGPVVRFEGWLTQAGSLGCSNCDQQPLHAVFRGSGGNWQGLLLYRGHYDPEVPIEPPPANVVIEEAIDRFPLVLERR